jgi:hypothetical protein
MSLQGTLTEGEGPVLLTTLYYLRPAAFDYVLQTSFLRQEANSTEPSPSVSVPWCLSFSVSVCLTVYISVCLSISVRQSDCLSVCMYVSIFVSSYMSVPSSFVFL